MPRYRRTLEDALKEMSGQSRTVAGLSLSTPALDSLGQEYLSPDSVGTAQLIDSSVTREILAPGAVGEAQIADFAIAVTKFKSDRHYLY